MSRLSQEQVAAIAALEELGDGVHVSIASRPEPVFEIGLSSCKQVTDDALSLLEPLEPLISLRLAATNITDEGVAQIARHKDLQTEANNA